MSSTGGGGSAGRPKTDAEQGIPAIDPAAADQASYASVGEGATLGAGGGAALGGAVGAAGGPAGSVLGAAAGAISGALAGGVVSHERGPTGSAVDMGRVAGNLGSGPMDVAPSAATQVPPRPGADSS